MNANNKLIARGGEIEFRAPNKDRAIDELARGLEKIFGGNCRFFKNELGIEKMMDNPPMRISDNIVEDVIPKLREIYPERGDR